MIQINGERNIASKSIVIYFRNSGAVVPIWRVTAKNATQSASDCCNNYYSIPL